MKESSFKVGTGIARISFLPEDFPIKQFIGVHDDLHIRVLIIDSNESFALVSIELTSLPSRAIAFYKKIVKEMTGIDDSHIWISVTHTFSAPHIPERENTSEESRISEVMFNRTVSALKDAIQQALRSKTAAKFGIGVGTCKINTNRNVETTDGWWFGNNELEYSNQEVRVGIFRDLNQHPLAVLYNYDVQPSVLDNIKTADGGKLISADMTGVASLFVEKEYGPGTVAIFLPGAAGDQAPILKGFSWDVDKDGKPRCTDIGTDAFILAKTLGNYLGTSILKAIKNCNNFTEYVRLQFNQIEISVPEQKRLYSTKELRPSKDYSFIYTGNKLTIPVNLLTLNDLLILATPPELNSSFGEKIRNIRKDRTTFICTLINGGMKYLPEQKDYERITYTAMNSMIGQGADKIFLTEIEKYLL